MLFRYPCQVSWCCRSHFQMFLFPVRGFKRSSAMSLSLNACCFYFFLSFSLFFFFFSLICMEFKIKLKKLIWKYPAGDLWCLVNYLWYLNWGSHHAGSSVLIITASSVRSPSQCTHWGNKYYCSAKDFTVSGQEKRCRSVHSVCASRKSSVSLNLLTVVSIEWEGADSCIRVLTVCNSLMKRNFSVETSEITSHFWYCTSVMGADTIISCQV